jgi:hypothetical protein
MKPIWRICLALALIAGGLALGISAAPFGLSADEARTVIARWLGPKSAIQVKEVTALGNSAVVVANIEAAFRFDRDEKGRWRIAEIRRGDNNWENIQALEQTLTAEKTARARAELELLAQGLEAFKREHGFYAAANTIAGLNDHLSPRYLKRIIRLDPWRNPYEYERQNGAYALRSRGADGKKPTPDDVEIRP